MIRLTVLIIIVPLFPCFKLKPLICIDTPTHHLRLCWNCLCCLVVLWWNVCFLHPPATLSLLFVVYWEIWAVYSLPNEYYELLIILSFTLLTLILLTWRIWWAPNNASRWQMGFNSAFKGLKFELCKCVRFAEMRSVLTDY